ncbi:Fic family protein [Fodinicurvata fenggangensis]|uniref:Fic family protein n=1 Tax=Fodinicurvata fenggangensis TaxID=1121830 RepID=UPI0005518A68|nr:Fic family protein [Fodinicurvata fenggangensis]
MARLIPEKELKAIEDIVRRHPEGVTAQEIAKALQTHLPRRTLQYRLQRLVKDGRLVSRGERRWTKYQPPAVEQQIEMIATHAEAGGAYTVPLSKESRTTREHLHQPPEVRNPVGYRREFLDTYRPNLSFYLSENERAHLAKVGKPTVSGQPAGTYAKQILNRLLIDLSWNSSRLEGNTYSLLDTRRLLEFGEEAEGRDRLEAQMILNHKDAIEFLVNGANEIEFNRHTILNLHAMLANNLLPDQTATGRLRHMAVGIERSTFYPLEVPHLIEECFDTLLATTSAIENPFEQAFFFMVQLPYLQPFDDVNKRVSRLAANIPLIKNNLTPLSFIDVPRDIYTDAMLAVYELNRISLLKDVFIWAYERSAARYAAVRQSLGEPDSFRMHYRDALRTIVGEIVKEGMGRKAALAHINTFARENVEVAEQERFREMAENELLALHDGNYARYRIRPSEFAAWQEIWDANSSVKKV